MLSTTQKGIPFFSNSSQNTYSRFSRFLSENTLVLLFIMLKGLISNPGLMFIMIIVFLDFFVYYIVFDIRTTIFHKIFIILNFVYVLMDEDVFFKRKVDFGGAIDPSSLYESMHDKMRSLNFTVYEKFHKKIVRGEVTDWFFKWECLRPVNSYVLYKIEIDFKFYNTKEVEVMENGQKVKRYKGFFRIGFESSMIIDYNNLWDSSRFKKYLRSWYDRLIFGRVPVKPQVHAFGEYKQRINKLNELMILVYNHLRVFYGLPEALGFQET